MNAIVAVDGNWGIGCKGKLLIHLPGDLKFFQKMTTGKTIVMGRETLKSLPGGKPLKDRRNIVLTRNEKLDVECEICHSIDEVKALLKEKNRDEVFICGGESVYKQILELCNKIYVTKINQIFEADTYFPNLDEN